jgi:hypothetical protein
MEETVLRKASLALCAALIIATPARAGSIVGGSSMLGGPGLAQLEAWLGQGPLTLTNIFTKGVDGSTSTDWHAAVDHQGATFSLLEMVAYDPEADANVTQIIGGYNPRSWDAATNGWVSTPNDADRTAFIFNLTTGVLQRQCLSTDPTDCGRDLADYGEWQTFDHLDYGPSFGGGQDIHVNADLDDGFSYNYSYGVPGSPLAGYGQQNGLDPNPGSSGWIAVGALETFTIAPFTGAVPAPGGPALFALGLLGLAVARRRGLNTL